MLEPATNDRSSMPAFDLTAYAQTLRNRAMIDEESLKEATADALHSLPDDSGTHLRDLLSQDPTAERLLMTVTYNLIVASSLAKTILSKGDFGQMWRDLRIHPDGIEGSDLEAYERAYFNLEVLTIRQGRDEIQKLAGVSSEDAIERLLAMRDYASTTAH